MKGLDFADNLNRARIKNAVELAPGIHLRGLQRSTRLSFSTVRHHVAKLARAGDIEYCYQGGFTRVFPRGFPASERSLASALRRDSCRQVLLELLHAKPMSNKEISSSTGLAKSTITGHLKLLKSLGIIGEEFSPEGRSKYTLQKPFRLAGLLRAGKAGLELASERYVELWDF